MIERKNIVILDDDQEICRLLHDFLTKHSYGVTIANHPQDLFALLDKPKRIDLIILDLMLPDMGGIEVCKQLRVKEHAIPVIMLTALTDDMEKILGLEIGADDYLTKPFNPHELLARARAVLRRFAPVSSELEGEEIVSDLHGKLLKFSNWTLNTASRQLFSPENIEISLSSRSYDLLLVFLEHPQHVLSRDHLLNILSHRSAEPFDRSIDVQISRLRQKLGDDSKEPKLIKTVRNGGYLFAASVKRA